MELLTPGLGLLIWQVIIFSLLLLLLAKFAWKPIMKALNDREESIENALASAEKAKLEMAKFNSDSEKLLKEARFERDRILKEGKEIKDSMINEAKSLAQTEGGKMIEKARAEINTQKMAALTEMKNQVATLSIEIAEKILTKQLKDKASQDSLVSDLLKDIKLN